MLRKGIATAALSLAALAALAPSTAKAQNLGGPTSNPWELTLGGTASNGPDVNGFNAAVNASIGYYFGNLEISGRQSLTYSDINTAGTGGKGSNLNASTRLALDLHFPMGDHDEFVPYVGANIGYVYGDSVKDTAEAAPEAGIKYYVNNNTFVFVDVEYQFFFNSSSDASQAISNGQFVYGLGIGFRF